MLLKSTLAEEPGAGTACRTVAIAAAWCGNFFLDEASVWHLAESGAQGSPNSWAPAAGQASPLLASN